MIEAIGLTKRYGTATAVDELSFTAPAGQVTGFLGPNGAGKSTTMRLILGLDKATSGTVTVNGKRYTGLRRPLTEVGALLEAKAVHPGRSAHNHLKALALSNGIPAARVDRVLETVGLGGVAGKRAGSFSLGMGQRLGIAAALLGDPAVLMLDEPVNGLDPEGVVWIRNLLKSLAADGRTVFLSSHLMSEIELTVDRLVVIGRGRLIAEMPIGEFLVGGSGNYIRVRTPQADGLAEALRGRGAQAATEGPQVLRVTGLSTDEVGQVAQANGVTLLELSSHQTSLEERYMELTGSFSEFHADADAEALVPSHGVKGRA
jgi:ABC-2 type transport system ATP-binding protein